VLSHTETAKDRGCDESLSRTAWEARRRAHSDRLKFWAEDRLRRGSRGAKHPVYDFLFEYYSFRAGHLLRWSPGFNVRLDDATPDDLDYRTEFDPCEGGQILLASAFPKHRLEYVDWALNYLETVQDREPSFACFGLHEWAMVYREDEVRHRKVPLRLTRADTDSVVEGGVRCSHYDAFRFFTPAAIPLNRWPLERSLAAVHDQPGCVHVTMDLYKFAYKIAPFGRSEVLGDAFELAVAAREMDMRASPYDLSAFGLAPIRIETREGREEYAAEQRNLCDRARPIRAELMADYRKLSIASMGRG